MKDTDIDILGVFSLLSILAVGGGTAVLPEMKAMTVEVHGWLTDSQFRDVYSLGQLAPGPNMLMVIVIGYHVAGTLGAVLAFTGFFLPASALTSGAIRISSLAMGAGSGHSAAIALSEMRAPMLWPIRVVVWIPRSPSRSSAPPTAAA